MAYLLGWTLLLLFRIYGARSLGSIRQDIISNSGSSFSRNSKMVPRKTESVPEMNNSVGSNTDRNVSIEERRTFPDRETNTFNIIKSDADTDAKQNLKRSRKSKDDNNNSIPVLHERIAANTGIENMLFQDQHIAQTKQEARNISRLKKPRKVPSGAPNRRGAAERRRDALNKKENICTELNNETSTGNTSNGCIGNTTERDPQEQKIFSVITMKYVAQAFPFVVNLVSIIFHFRRPNKTNVAMYIIAMNVMDLISVTLGFSWVLLNSNGSRLIGEDQIAPHLMRFVDIWIKQGSYLVNLLLTIERFQVVKYPMHYTQIWNVSKAKWVLFTTILVFVISHVIGVVSFATVLRNQQDRSLFTMWNIASGVVFVVIPVTAIVILNTTTSIVFCRQSRNIRQTCEGFTLVQVMRREKKMVTNLVITTTILILTSSPTSLWTMFSSQNNVHNLKYKIVQGSFSALSYFGNGLAFIILMALSIKRKSNIQVN